jgi:hypothetical protein
MSVKITTGRQAGPARLAAIAAAAAVAAGAGAALALEAPAPQPPAISTISTQAGSPPALTLQAVQAQPEFPSAKAHWDALVARAKPPRKPMPDWTGAYLNQAPVQFSPGYNFSMRTNAPLREKYAKIYSDKMDNVAKGIEWDPLSACFPAGFPRMMAEPRIFEFITTPHNVWILQEVANETHRIYTDGRGFPAEDEAYPRWEGDAVGMWDDDTLLVYTKNIMGTADGYQRNGIVQTDKIEVIEQYRKISPDTIVLQMTVYDPEVLSRPWRTAPRVFKRALQDGKEVRPDYYGCATSPVTRNADGTTQIILPGERAGLGFSAP